MADVLQLGVVASLPERAPAVPQLVIGSDVEIASQVLNVLRNEFGEVVHSEGGFCVWAKTHWRRLEDREVIHRIRPFDGATYPTARGQGCIRLGKSRIESIVFVLRAEAEQPHFFDSPRQGINCASGLIVFDQPDKPAVIPHHPDHRRRHVLAGRWPAAGQVALNALLCQLLEGVFLGDPDADAKTELLAEIAGVAALGIATQISSPKAIVLYGPSAENGKSQILNLLRGLLPPEAVAEISPRKFDDDRFLIRLAGVLLNAVDEIGGDAIFSESFKALVTGDHMTGRDVYRSATTFKPSALHVLAGNTLPSFAGGMDAGVRRRLLVIRFNRKIPLDERIADLGARIGREEADALLAWAVGGAARLIQRGSFEEPFSSRQALLEWITLSDVVGGWLRDHEQVVVTENPADVVSTKVAYKQFSLWCTQEGIPRMQVPRHADFTQRVGAAGIKGLICKRLKSGRQLSGMRLVSSVPEGR